MKTLTKAACSLLMTLPLVACAQPEEPAKTQTNEQGCTYNISRGPQDPYQNPPPLKQACLGPHLLEIPQHYYETQMGPWFDGLFALALEYPSLEPFKPGERMNLSVDVSVRTVYVKYTYIDRTTVEEVMRKQFAPTDSRREKPEGSLETRIRGEPDNGLTPYYVDMAKVIAHYRAKGYAEDAPVMRADWHTDWFLSEDAGNEVTTVIKCTAREVASSGVEYREGKMVKSDEYGMASCDHILMMPELDLIVRIRYPREGLHQWMRIDGRARQMMSDFMVKNEGEAN